MTTSPTSTTGAVATITYTDPSDKLYFYGRLLREEANRILEKKGTRDGLFLLRESVFEVGAYILSLCYSRAVQHYKIERQEDGTVAIGRGGGGVGGPRFPGPVELVRHHQAEQGGLVTRPTVPCNRADDDSATVQPIKYLFIHDVDLYKLVNQEISRQMSFKLKLNQSMSKQEYDEEMEAAKGRYRYKYEKTVAKSIHFTQAWFKREVTRDEANRLLVESGVEDGKFLVRANASKGNNNEASLEYKISLCFKGEVKHYQIKAKVCAGVDSGMPESHFFIDDSFEFDTIIQLVDYFHRCSVGFLCNLRIAYMPPVHITDTLIDSAFSLLNQKILSYAYKFGSLEFFNNNNLFTLYLLFTVTPDLFSPGLTI
jgi:hypothetical protein